MIDPQDKVDDLKAIIEETKDIEISQQVIKSAGVELENFESLLDYI